MVSYTESRVSFAKTSTRKTATKAWNWYQWWLSRKAGTNFRLEHSLQKNFSTVTTAKVVFLLLSNRIFWNGFVNGKQPRRNLLRAMLQKFLRLLLSQEFWQFVTASTVDHKLHVYTAVARRTGIQFVFIEQAKFLLTSKMRNLLSVLSWSNSTPFIS